METWLKDRLSICLDFDVPDDLLKMILAMKTSEEVDNYFQSLLNDELPEHRCFINDFKQRRFGRNKGNNIQKQAKTGNNNSNGSLIKKQERPESPCQTSVASTSETNSTGATKKKKKYVNLYTQDGQFNDTVLLKGRHRCECQAAKHKLINNCMRCGRIVCKQEGSGPCLFCGNLVCSEEEQKLIKTASKKGDNLKNSLMEQNRPKGWEEAIAQRNRILEYDRTSERRTTVIDDESDYFKANSVWLSDSEKKKLARLEQELSEKKHASQLSRKITIDFSGREVFVEPQITVEYEDKILKEIAQSCSNDSSENTKSIKNKQKKNLEISDDVHPCLDLPPPIFIPSVVNNNSSNKNNELNKNYDGVYNRIQDKELLEIQDMRHCLSMHQPWASLLVNGIKQHEGRSWYTAHRGRLWIASTSKPVDLDEIKRIEQFYKMIYNDTENKLNFPKQYPSGVLLGCVSLQECLTQEVYRKEFPNGESESTYVFVCNNAQELPIKFPIKGEHKIYKLDEKIHTAAVKSLTRISKLKAEDEFL